MDSGNWTPRCTTSALAIHAGWELGSVGAVHGWRRGAGKETRAQESVGWCIEAAGSWKQLPTQIEITKAFKRASKTLFRTVDNTVCRVKFEIESGIKEWIEMLVTSVSNEGFGAACTLQSANKIWWFGWPNYQLSNGLNGLGAASVS